STVSKDSLKASLLQLECHFTWTLLKEHVGLEALEETVLDHIKFVGEYNIRDYNMLSYVCHLKNSEEEALRNLRKAEEAIQKHYPGEIARRSLVTWGNYAWIYYHMQRYEEAQSYVSKVESSRKKLSSTAHETIQLPEVYAEKGWALLRFGRNYFEGAKNCFADALRSEPNNPDFNAGYAIAMYRLEDCAERYGDERTPCLDALKRAVKLNPSDTTILALLALRLQRSGRGIEGEKYIEEGLQKTPDFPVFLRHAANFYRKKKDVNKALEILKKALALTPNSVVLHHQLGLCYRSKIIQLKKRYAPQEEVENLVQLAIFHLKTAIDKKPVFFIAYGDLGSIYALGKRYEEAEEIFQEVLHRNDLPCDEKQEIYFSYGNFQQLQMKSESEAIKYYIEGLKIEKDSFGRKKCSEAVEKLLKQKIESGLGDATVFGTLGLVHKLNGKKQEAIECYKNAIDLDPNNEEYQNALVELQLSI
ncbi:IFIT5 protein, partial [Cettia cetti]|nr:IFIT5 protein [Cettia cetti]